MTRCDIRASLDRSLEEVRFTAGMRQAVLERQAPRRSRRALRRGAAAALACAVMITAAMAAGPRLWELIQRHMGERAPFASQPQVSVTDQGLEFGVAAALADRNIIRAYLTIRDLEGDRLRQGAELEMGANAWEAETGGTLSLTGSGDAPEYDSQSGTLILCRTFFRQFPTEELHLLVREITPGYREFFVDFNMEKLAEAVPEGILESAVGGDGKYYLLPEQNPMSMDWERCPLPEGEEPGIWISSMGYAGDGRLHVRFQWREDVALLQLQRPPFGSCEMELMATFPDGVDYAFPADRPGREDLLDNQIFFFNGSYSAQGDAVAGDWELRVPLELVDSLELAWSGGKVAGADGLEASVGSIWLSPLSVSVSCTGYGGITRLETMGKPVVTLQDGTQAVLRDGVRAAQNWENGLSVSREELVWELEVPVEPDQVESVTFCGETMTVKG